MIFALTFLLSCSECSSTGHLERYNKDSFKVMAETAGDWGIVHLTSGEIAFAWKIAKRESSGRPSARNGQHRGLFQRAEKVHGNASPCPLYQLKWADEYARRRYGGWQEAWEFWKRRKRW